MINSNQLKQTCHSMGSPNSRIIQCTPSSGNAGVYSHIQTVIKVPNVILRKTLPSILHLLSQFGNGCGRLSRKSKFPLHYVPYMFNWREIWGSCWLGQYTAKNTLLFSSRMWTCVVLLKSTSSSCRRNGSSMGLTTCAI